MRIKAGLEMPIKEWKALSSLANRNKIQGTQEEIYEKYLITISMYGMLYC